MQSPEEPKRVHVPVERAVDRPAYIAADRRQTCFRLSMIEDLVWMSLRVSLIVQPSQAVDVRLHFPIGQTKCEAARLVEADVDPRVRLEILGQARPSRSRGFRPAGVCRKTDAFSLNPDEGEVGSRRTQRDVALVEDADPHTSDRKPPGQAGAHETASDNSDVGCMCSNERHSGNSQLRGAFSAPPTPVNSTLWRDVGL